MSRLLRSVAFLAVLSAALPAQAQVDINLLNLLNGLTTGTPVTLLTPAGNGLVQVTSFTPPGPLSAVQAAAVVEQARATLAAFGVQQPTGQQLATALVGGTLDMPTGRTQVRPLLPAPAGAPPPNVQSQVIFASSLPQVVGPTGVPQVPGAPGVAAGTGLAGIPQLNTQALQLATQQLQAIGIGAPTNDQLRIALLGGTITTAGGSFNFPGVIASGAAGGLPPGNAAAGGTGAPIGGAAPAISPLPIPSPQGARPTTVAPGARPSVVPR